MRALLAGEKLVECLIPDCEHQQVAYTKESVFKTQCERCGKVFVRVLRARPTVVRGCGRNKVADLGLALLMEMGAGAPEIEENWQK